MNIMLELISARPFGVGWGPSRASETTGPLVYLQYQYAAVYMTLHYMLRERKKKPRDALPAAARLPVAPGPPHHALPSPPPPSLPPPPPRHPAAPFGPDGIWEEREERGKEKREEERNGKERGERVNEIDRDFCNLRSTVISASGAFPLTFVIKKLSQVSYNIFLFSWKLGDRDASYFSFLRIK